MVDSPTRQGNGAAGEQVAPLPIFYRRPRPLNSEVDRGKLLVHRSGDWIATPPMADLVLKASPLEQRVENDDATVSSIKGADHHGVSQREVRCLGSSDR